MIYDLPLEKSARPTDWILQSLDQLADVAGGGTPETGVAEYWHPPEILWVTPTDITACRGNVLTWTERAISQSGLRESSAKLLPIGTTLLTSRATIGECRLAGVPVATNQGFASLVPRVESDSRFLFYLAQTLKPVLVRLAAGTTFIEVSRREIRRVNVCVPQEPKEREDIGRILSIADEAIAAAEKQLTSAQRLKTAMMQQLFTRGLPGYHKRFKGARVFRYEFEVPENWGIDPLRDSVESVEYGTNAPSNEDKHGLPVIAIPEVITARFRLGECSFAEVSEQEAKALRLESGDVLLVRTNGNSDYMGKSTVIGAKDAEQHIIFASYLIRVRTRTNVLSGKYLNYFLASPLGRRQCLAMANTSAGNHNLGSRSIKQFCLPRPSPEEQLEIVRLVDTSEDAIDAAALEVEKLNRLKCSLLQNLMTGQVRVRV